MPHLLSVALKQAPKGEATFPFFVGENGSGKSTLLEGIAAAAKLPTVGGSEVDRDATLEAQRRLAAALRLTWAKGLVAGPVRASLGDMERRYGRDPGARYSFDRAPLASVAYEDLDHVTLTRDFLNNPRAFLHRLRSDP